MGRLVSSPCCCCLLSLACWKSGEWQWDPAIHSLQSSGKKEAPNGSCSFDDGSLFMGRASWQRNHRQTCGGKKDPNARLAMDVCEAGIRPVSSGGEAGEREPRLEKQQHSFQGPENLLLALRGNVCVEGNEASTRDGTRSSILSPCLLLPPTILVLNHKAIHPLRRTHCHTVSYSFFSHPD